MQRNDVALYLIYARFSGWSDIARTTIAQLILPKERFAGNSNNDNEWCVQQLCGVLPEYWCLACLRMIAENPFVANLNSEKQLLLVLYWAAKLLEWHNNTHSITEFCIRYPY